VTAGNGAAPTRGAALYARLAGLAPDLRPWHFQWLSARALSLALGPHAASLGRTVLDVGSGAKPYADLLRDAGVTRHVGLDVRPGSGVDVLIEPGSPWPLADGCADGVLCTQVLEFVDDPDGLLAEITRALRPGGHLLLAAPFVYNEHGPVPGADLTRWTRAGLARLVGRHLEVVRVDRFGGPACVLVTLTLNGLDATLSGRRRALKLLALPVLFALALVLNRLALLIDQLVPEPRTYLGSVVVARRP